MSNSSSVRSQSSQFKLQISEIDLTYDDTENVKILDREILPCYFADGFCKPTTKTPYTLIWFSDNIRLIFTLQDFVGGMTKIENRYWIETDSFAHSSIPNNSDTTFGFKGTSFPYVHSPHTHNPHKPSLSRFGVFTHAQTFCSKPEPLFATQYFDPLLHIPMVSKCIQDNQSIIQS